MRVFQRQQNSTSYVRRFIVRSVVVLALFVLMVFLARAAWGMYGHFVEAQTEGHATEAQLYTLSQRKEAVAGSVAALSTDRGIEAEIRNRYGVAKPGEGKIEIVQNNSSDASAAPVAPKSNIFMRVIKALFVW